MTIQGNKVLRGRLMLPGEFTFQLHDEYGNLVATATNGLLGGIELVIDDIAAPGTYLYTVSELAGTAAHVVYDTALFQVEVQVVNDNGELKATVVYPTGGINFVNTYRVPGPPASPKTGDSMFGFWMTLMLLGGAGFLLSSDKKLRKKER